ncbi:uncharacterized membrane protein YheB (UPF0754 family) [Alkalihalobacillus xiaoxiensis]|uniref:Uncharacterized membrane protein YheB (UPF0754 family) n=1 Tax=Shouchella xiaoxiensis TaxID=766895 RepID=A0ABS2SU12_9BACI|nr:uncharacterized membrane protein YheB (UPF0754 family) [Shouchella xiaoxiensis]
MQWISLVGLLAVVGAIVGAATNALAIRMLFRPHRAYYIGKWQLPFTPGLLPRRQGELSKQLGNIVANHLVTAEGLGKKIGSELFTNEINAWLKSKIYIWLRSEHTVESLLKPLLSFDNGKEQIVIRSKDWLRKRILQFLRDNGTTSARKIVPIELQANITAWLPEASSLILKKARAYVDSEEGMAKSRAMAKQFLSSRGKLGGMVSMFLSSEKLVDLALPEIRKFLDDERTRDMLHGLLAREWNQMLDRPLSSYQAEQYVDGVIDRVTDGLQGQIPVLNWYDAPLHTWTEPFIEPIASKWAPELVKILSQNLQQNMGSVLKRLNLEEIIEQQVSSFSMAHLEQLIMNITKRELRMITFLGGLIGGIVGLVQAIIVHFFY